MKKTISFILCIIVIISCCEMLAFAVVDGSKYTNISTISYSLTISGINSTSKASLQAKSSMSISIKMELQKLKSGSYSTIKTWTASKTGLALSMEETRLINVLSTYRLKVTFTAGSETVVSYAYP